MELHGKSTQVLKSEQQPQLNRISYGLVANMTDFQPGDPGSILAKSFAV